MRDIGVSEQRFVPMRDTGTMVFEKTQGDEPTHAVALGFGRCGAAVRDLFLQRVKHGALRGDDQGLTLIARPCDVEIRQLLVKSPGILTVDLLKAFGEGLPKPASRSADTLPKLTGKAKAMHRLRSAFDLE